MEMQWISVKERLPEPLTDVLACHNGKHVRMGYMFDDGEWILSRMYGEVTHWMPLPEPPQQGGE